MIKRSGWLKSGVILCAVSAAALLAFRQGVSAASEPKPLSSFDPQVKPLLAQMTLDEKIGQMTQPDQEQLTDLSEIEKCYLGSVLSGGTSDPKEGNSLKAWTDLYDRIQQHTANTRLKIPLLYGIDAVHGHNNVLGAVIFPHNIGLGCTRNPALVEKIGAHHRRRSARDGHSVDLRALRHGAAGRTMGPHVRGLLRRSQAGGAAWPRPRCAGFQGRDLADPLAVLACAKHYIGDGGTAFGTGQRGRGLDQGDTRVDEATLRRIHLPGYIAASQAGVGSIMPSYSSWNGVKCSASKRLLTEILKQELGFRGLPDFRLQRHRPDRSAITKSPSAFRSTPAWIWRWCPESTSSIRPTSSNWSKTARCRMSRIDDAVTRILRVKFALGLMDRNRSPLADRISAEIVRLARAPRTSRAQAVRESLVLLKNQNKVLPLCEDRAAHPCGRQERRRHRQPVAAVGPSIGKARAATITPGGTTLLAAIRKAAQGAQVTFSNDGEGATGATVGVVVIGEKPYAEFEGDRADLSLAPEDLAAVRARESRGHSGGGDPLLRPADDPRRVARSARRDHRRVAAGHRRRRHRRRAFRRLQAHRQSSRISWPRNMQQIPLHAGDRNYDPLLPYGYGLSY